MFYFLYGKTRDIKLIDNIKISIFKIVFDFSQQIKKAQMFSCTHLLSIVQ